MTTQKKSKVDETLDHYYFNTEKSSNIARQIAILEGAIFWAIYVIYKSQCPPAPLFVAFYISLIIFFICDISQYIYAASQWKKEAQTMKKIDELNPDIKDQIKYKIGDTIGESINLFYILKLLFLGISTILLLVMCGIYLIAP